MLMQIFQVLPWRFSPSTVPLRRAIKCGKVPYGNGKTSIQSASPVIQG